jgi:hypothetical protein
MLVAGETGHWRLLPGPHGIGISAPPNHAAMRHMRVKRVPLRIRIRCGLGRFRRVIHACAVGRRACTDTR